MNEASLGQYLKKLRKSYGYTQEFVASHIEKSRQEYSHYETGRAVPSPRTCSILADFYDIPKNYLIAYLTNTEIMQNEQSIEQDSIINEFLDFIGSKDNAKKLYGLSRKEKELIYYFSIINPAEQDEIIEILKIKIFKKEKN